VICSANSPENVVTARPLLITPAPLTCTPMTLSRRLVREERLFA
jgi:hypothetical protein